MPVPSSLLAKRHPNSSHCYAAFQEPEKKPQINSEGLLLAKASVPVRVLSCALSINSCKPTILD